MRWRLLLLFFASTASGQTRSSEPPLPRGFELIHLPNTDGVIVSAQFAPRFLSRPRGTADYWTPTRTDVFQMEARLQRYVHEQALGRPLDLARHRRHYVGVRNGQRKLVWVEFTCEMALHERDYSCSPAFVKSHQEMKDSCPFDWRIHELNSMVSDGGDCFCEVTYAPATGQFLGFRCHGVA
jgi:hypothetical protein